MTVEHLDEIGAIYKDSPLVGEEKIWLIAKLREAVELTRPVHDDLGWVCLFCGKTWINAGEDNHKPDCAVQKWLEG